ncbi:MAG: glycoside hydrolase family 16 protein [Clostridia bacterium]|nr:glycoside hydrolase family 16 protein [Clostridia bacterium]
MKEYKVDNHVSSFLPEGHNWKLIWHDEFDGCELDESKWFYRLNLGGKRHETYIEDAISFDGKSNIIFHLVEKDGQYYSSTIQTGENYTDKPNGESRKTTPKFMHKYGYYEVRCKLQCEQPWWTAFWIQSPEVANEELPPEKAGVEVDIMESFSPGRVIPHFNHWGGYGKNHKFTDSAGLNRVVSDADAFSVSLDEYHTFACHWTKDGYTYYVDGKPSGKISGPVSDTEQFVLLFTECKGYRDNIPGYSGVDKFGSGIKDKFVVDYVRVFDEV